LQRLEFQRLVDIRDGIGTIVTGVDFHALRNVYELRLRITELIGDFSPSGVPEETLATVNNAVARAKSLHRRPEARAFWRIESDRHPSAGPGTPSLTETA
jgi:DNA-binding GntR family transcriptional regulator